MSDTLKLLDKARRRCEPPTWYKLAQELHVTPQRMSNWTRGKHRPDIDACYRLADFLRVDRGEVMAVILAEQYHGRPQREFWNRIAPRLLPAAIIGLTLAGNHVRQEASEDASKPSKPTILYIMRITLYVKRWLQRGRRIAPRVGRARGRFRPPALRPHPQSLISLTA